MAAGNQPATHSSEDPEATRIVLPRADPPSGLARGVRLRDFQIERVVGEGGFSIVYAAIDVNLRRRVAIKEYMPAALARRRDDRTIQPRSVQDRETFELGRRSFLNEAQLLARFDHPALVKVHQFWEENGTAYMVMPLYEGPTLKQSLKDQARPPSEQWLKQLLQPLLDALECLHAENVFHRDVAPDNILLLDGGSPVLLDLGAARQVLADSTKALTAILKPSYAPIEQYADMAQLRQGPWTDGYALCAVLYFAITGAAPPSAVARSISDKMVPASKAAAGRYSSRFLRGIDAGLAVRPEARPQSIAQLRELLLISGPATIKRAAAEGSAGQAQPSGWLRGYLGAGAAGLISLLLLAIGVALWLTNVDPGDRSKTEGSIEQGSALPSVTREPTASPSTEFPRVPNTPVDPQPAVVPGPAEAASAKVPPLPSTEQAASAEKPAVPSDLTLTRPRPALPQAPLSTPAQPAAISADRARGEPPRRVEREESVRVAREPSGRARCLQIVQRMQLGELPTDEEKAYLKKECT